jgi:PAS domain S-box-containing protein
MRKRLTGHPELFEAILDQLPDGITILTDAGELLYVNTVGAQLMGHNTPQEAVAAGPQAIIDQYDLFDETGHPLPPERFPGRRALKGEDGSEIVIQVKPKNGGPARWSAVRAAVIESADHEVKLVVNVFQDVTRLKQAQEQLLKANQRITNILEGVMRSVE